MRTKQRWAVVATAGMVAAGGLAPAAAATGRGTGGGTSGGTGTAAVTRSATTDLANVVYSAEHRNGAISRSSTTRLGEDAFGRARLVRKSVREAKPVPASTLQPALLRLIASGDPRSSVEVVVTYRDDLRLPVFPVPDVAAGRTSERNQAQLAQARRLISGLEERRADRYAEQTRAVERLGGKALQTYWLVQALHASLPLAAVRRLAASDDVVSIELADGVARPPADANPDNDLEDARAQLRSDPYAALGQTAGWIGLLDTGVRTTHRVFNGPDHLAITSDVTGDGDPTDQCDHGTASAGEITGNAALGGAWRGVSAISLDSWDVYGDDCLVGGADAIEGFQQAVAWLDKVIVAELQIEASERSGTSLAADAAFDTGSVVIAANGNSGPGAGTVRSPGNAHRALGIGAADLVSDGLMDYSGRGPTTDGRYKPDLVFPTNVETARSSSDTALGSFGGTSAATPLAGGVAALLRNWMRGGTGSIDAGHVYSQLVLGGQTAWPFDNSTGAGPFRLGVSGRAWWGKTGVAQAGKVDVPIAVAPGRTRLEGALWWPETTARHNDVDLQLIAPDGSVRASSSSGVSVFERATVARATPGTWKLRITGFSVTGNQTVHWSARTS